MPCVRQYSIIECCFDRCNDRCILYLELYSHGSVKVIIICSEFLLQSHFLFPGDIQRVERSSTFDSGMSITVNAAYQKDQIANRLFSFHSILSHTVHTFSYIAGNFAYELQFLRVSFEMLLSLQSSSLSHLYHYHRM